MGNSKGVKGSDVISRLKQKLGIKTDKDLAAWLGRTVPSVQDWNDYPSVTAEQVAGLVAKACKAATKRAQLGSIRPLVEFFRLDKCESAQGALRELFSTETDGGGEHRYLHALYEELDKCHGVYIFFDSRGRAIYAGKACKLSLWLEMIDALNRPPAKKVHKIKRVTYPKNEVVYRPNQQRKIKVESVPLHELAAYFSAYEVPESMIATVEALLVRSFANDLLNVKMEQFASQQKASPR